MRGGDGAGAMAGAATPHRAEAVAAGPDLTSPGGGEVVVELELTEEALESTVEELWDIVTDAVEGDAPDGAQVESLTATCDGRPVSLAPHGSAEASRTSLLAAGATPGVLRVVAAYAAP